MDFKIQYGKFENLPIEGEIGTVYYTTDTHQLFVCLLDTKVLEEIKVSEAEQATELYYLNDDGEKILLTPEEITSIGTTLLQNVKNNQLIIGNKEGELISLEGLNTEEGLISSILEIDANGVIQQHSVLPPRLGGTGLSVQTQTAAAVIKELLKKAESGDIKQLIDNAGNGSNRITYTTATDSINNEIITLKQYYGFDEGVTYKIKLNGDLPANAVIAESNATNAKAYPIVDLKGNAMRGGEAIKDSYIELTYSDGKFFFKGGGGERPRKLKGFVEFTEDGTFCPADYGLQAGDEIKILRVDSGYYPKNEDKTVHSNYAEFYKTEVDISPQIQIENSENIITGHGVGGYIPGDVFKPSEYLQDTTTYRTKLSGGEIVRKSDYNKSTAGVGFKTTYDNIYDLTRSLTNIPKKTTSTSGCGFGATELRSSHHYGYNEARYYTNETTAILTPDKLETIFVKVGNSGSNEKAKHKYPINNFQCIYSWQEYLNDSYKIGMMDFYSKFPETKDIDLEKIYIQASYPSGGFLDSKGNIWDPQVGIISTDLKYTDKAYMNDAQYFAYFRTDNQQYYWINPETSNILYSNGTQGVQNINISDIFGDNYNSNYDYHLTQFGDESLLLFDTNSTSNAYILLPNSSEWQIAHRTSPLKLSEKGVPCLPTGDTYSVTGKEYADYYSLTYTISEKEGQSVINLSFKKVNSGAHYTRFYYNPESNQYQAIGDGNREWTWLINLTGNNSTWLSFKEDIGYYSLSNKPLLISYLGEMKHSTTAWDIGAPGYCKIFWDIDETV